MLKAHAQQEELVPLKVPREQIHPVSQVRSTLLASSLKALRERNRFESYLQLLPRHHHDAVVSAVAGTWHPVELMLAHYEACDGLGVSEEELYEIGQSVGASLHATLMGMVLRMVTEVGVTPWRPLGYCGALWERLYQGGGVRLLRLGPKEAVIECVGNPLHRSSYFRGGQRGLIQAAVKLFCTKSYVLEQLSPHPHKRMCYRISWV
jgi:hypothetical protein